MRTIAVVNQKGGCGKTTVSINLASAMAQLGKRVLLVDMDPQSHCAVGLAVPEDQIEQSIYDVLVSHTRNEPIRLSEVLWQISERLELAPASIDLAAFEQQLAGTPEPELCLKRVLDEVSDVYNFAIIDCPPAVGLLTFNALRAATDVIVPVETGYFALHGLSKQLETLSLLCQKCKQQVNVRVLASMYDIRTKMAREVLAQLRSHFADRMLKTVINFNTKIKEAASFGQPINEYDPASKGHQDFRRLAEEIIGIEPVRESRQIINTLAEQLEAISTSAGQLLASAKDKHAQRPRPAGQQQQGQPEIREIQTQTPEPTQGQTDQKLATYYGVHAGKGAVTFVTLYPRAKTVLIAGDFNNWQPEQTPMEKVSETGIWQAKIELPPGSYRYRYVVDGQWQQDPYNEQVEPNPFGEYNSVVEVI